MEKSGVLVVHLVQARILNLTAGPASWLVTQPCLPHSLPSTPIPGESASVQSGNQDSSSPALRVGQDLGRAWEGLRD